MIKFLTCLTTFIFLFTSGCNTGNIKEKKQSVYTYANSTDYTTLSLDTIDGGKTYELIFELKETSDCFNIDIEGIYLQKSFPLEKFPQKVYFIVEKKFQPEYFPKSKTYWIQLGKNFNKEWEIFTPLTICSNKNDPLTKIENGLYRIRWTTFQKLPHYYIISIKTDMEIQIPVNPSK